MLYTHDKSFNGMLVFLCALARNPLASVGAIAMLLWALLPAVAHAAAGDADAAFGVGGYVRHAASRRFRDCSRRASASTTVVWALICAVRCCCWGQAWPICRGFR